MKRIRTHTHTHTLVQAYVCVCSLKMARCHTFIPWPKCLLTIHHLPSPMTIQSTCLDVTHTQTLTCMLQLRHATCVDIQTYILHTAIGLTMSCGTWWRRRRCQCKNVLYQKGLRFYILHCLMAFIFRLCLLLNRWIMLHIWIQWNEHTYTYMHTHTHSLKLLSNNVM